MCLGEKFIISIFTKLHPKRFCVITSALINLNTNRDKTSQPQGEKAVLKTKMCGYYCG